MNFFKCKDVTYEDIIQLDGGLSITHINYGKTPLFNGNDGRGIAKNSRIDSYSSLNQVDNILEVLYDFNGTEKGLKKEERLDLWKAYWLEYTNAFGQMSEFLPQSVVTAYVGRHAIEVGLKYLLLKESGEIKNTHELNELVSLFFSQITENEEYLGNIAEFCSLYSKYIEGENVEYFRFPDYKKNNYFAGNRLDIEWLSYNFSLVLLKLLHYAGLDEEFFSYFRE